jgi:hypothetical protein
MKHDGGNLEYTPENMKTQEICYTAVCNCPTKWDQPSMAFVPEKFKTKELCEAAVRHNEKACEYVPEEIVK